MAMACTWHEVVVRMPATANRLREQLGHGKIFDAHEVPANAHGRALSHGLAEHARTHYAVREGCRRVLVSVSKGSAVGGCAEEPGGSHSPVL